MPADPDSYELSRQIERMRTDMQVALGKVEERLERKVDKDVYAESQTRQGERMGAIEKAASETSAFLLNEVEKVKTTLGRINFTAWSGIVIPLGVGVVIAVLLYATGLR